MTRFTIHLSVETFDRSIGTDFVEKLKTGSVAQAPGGVDLEYMGAETRKSFDVVPDILQFIVTAARDVDINLFAAWLFTCITKKPVVKITINKRELTTFTLESMQRILEEEITIDDYAGFSAAVPARVRCSISQLATI